MSGGDPPAAAEPPLGPGLAAIEVRVPRAEVALLRYLLEAEEGLAVLYGDGAGRVWLVTPEARLAELRRWVDDVLPSVRGRRIDRG
ncbi:MAG: DUF4911 domain-containing protein [Sandaracinaceae bacterium]